MLVTFNGAHSTDKLEGDGGHILTPPPSILRSVLWIF